MVMKNSEECLEMLLSLSRKRGADKASANLIRSSGSTLKVRMGKLESAESSTEQRVSLGVLKGKKAAYVTTNLNVHSDKSIFENLVDKALAAASAVPEDPYLIWPEVSQFSEHKGLLPRDESPLSFQEMKASALEAESTALSKKNISDSEGAEAFRQHNEYYLGLSNGFHGAAHSSAYGLHVSVLAGKGDARQQDGYGRQQVRLKDLESPSMIGAKAAQNAARLLNPEQPPSGQFPVVFENFLVPRVLGYFLSSIDGSSIVRGTSFLRDAMHKKIFSEDITIVDDPTVPYTFGASFFDAEGLPCQKRALVKEGVLQSWLLNLREASLLNLASTGHAAFNIGGAPGISSYQTYVSPSKKTLAQMMKDIGEGFFVTDFLGSSGVNSLTGDFSLGARGLWINGGTLTHAVSEVTLAGKLQDVFQTMRAANDLVTVGSFCVPSVSAQGLTLSSNVA